MPIWTDSAACDQRSSDEEQVAEGEQSEQLRPIPCQQAIPGLHVAELAIDDPERMFNLGSDHGGDPVGLLVASRLWTVPLSTSTPTRI